ncbi:MAG: 1-deoxy-D-xylulose-5-phosphate reductoisomerase, partial [Ruminococcaceae bacterium]|nr:1-deoxy-D-xylulose-5-phosphate reductoisomerase [Oscillospiraceae bacterium]
MKQVSILGCTGSIGTQSLDVCEKANYQVHTLCAHRNITLLEQQARKFSPKRVIVTDEAAAAQLKISLADTDIPVLSGFDALLEAVQDPSQDVIINSLMGVLGLLPTVKALEAGNMVALANKETLVAGGKLVTNLAKEKNMTLVPIDSEHSAIFQCLQGNHREQVEKLIITASGGPFFGKTREELVGIKKEQALKHPNWSMGAKI